jgi:hypothetical protein
MMTNSIFSEAKDLFVPVSTDWADFEEITRVTPLLKAGSVRMLSILTGALRGSVSLSPSPCLGMSS